MTPSSSDQKHDVMYVGYRPLPRAHARFLQIALPLAVTTMLLGLAGIASSLQPAGTGRWDTATERTWSGRLTLEPYPMLHPAGEDAGRPLLVINMAKHGAQERLAEFDGLAVTLTGYLIERSGRRLIELLPDADAVRGVEDSGVAVRSRTEEAGPFEQFGKIVDGKCYLGVMRPGHGTTHKACATLCIAGGLPPLFAWRDKAGHLQTALITVEGRAVLSDDLLQDVGEPRVLTGKLSLIGDLKVIEAEDLQPITTAASAGR